MISKIYDPVDLALPFLLNGKMILQELCRSNYNWDDAVPNDSVAEWENWTKKLQLLKNQKIRRFFKHAKFGNVTD